MAFGTFLITMRSEPVRAARPAASGRLIPLAREDSLRARLAARDEGALRELVDLTSPWLLAVATGILHDQDEAEDVVLEAFRVAWEKVPPPDEGPRGLIPWLLQVTRNRAIDRLRARRRRLRLNEQAAAWAPEAATPTEPDEAGQPGWHVHRSVHQALSGLPEDQRHAVQLAYFEGRTHSEIAEHLALPLGTVKTRVRLGLARLRAALAPLRDWVA